ncbi:PAS domain S-box-containing protein [Caulobacter ginsengisoli]|uniref:histidine kinase n=1 Tax=Caulobacter ginsengisoli TaxID=400775 RepID=A0ABU0IQ64_9CAUL|nr:ATP-binding protein [Caulobacter ginsengisoli]MDQ0464154.1 PAS domain S-box-containing protein [Caulobacter ginsengisoli]
MISLLDDGLDTLASHAHRAWPLRNLVLIGVAAFATLMLPLTTCVLWGLILAACEGWSWFATRAQFKGQVAGRWLRLSHLGTVVTVSSGWMVLGAMLWNTGRGDAAVCAVTIWLSVIFFAQTFAYQSTGAFLAAGVIPAMTMLATLALAPTPDSFDMIPVWALLILALLFAGDGVGIMMDARRRTLATQAEAQDNAERYRFLADNQTDVIMLTALSGERLYVSPSIRQMLGVAPDDMRPVETMEHLCPDDGPAVMACLSALRRDGGQRSQQYRVVRADGSHLWVETLFTLIPAEGDRQARVLSVSRDIQARKQLEQDLVEALCRAEAAAAAKTDFLANMSHELRTPLNAIIGFSALLEGAQGLAPQQARHAHLIHQASAALLEVVNGVLDFSRLEAGAVELDPQPFDPAAEAASLCDLLTDQAAAKGLTLAIKAEGPPVRLIGDAPRLRQVLLNYLSNALKFTSQGGVTVTVRTTPTAAGAHTLRVEVADTGVGVPAAQLGLIFERFTQSDASISRKFGGAGLGLTICRHLLELMDGQVGADSVEGQGSTFWFQLDLPAAPMTLAADAATDAAAATAELDRPLRLLLVEDVAVNRELVATLLSPFDIQIDTAENGEQALQCVERAAYDLILMDMQMPIMDGLTATRAIRARGLRVPIIAMTANVLPEQVARCREAGMDDHLGKPIAPGRLLEVIGRWTGGEGVEAEAAEAG